MEANEIFSSALDSVDRQTSGNFGKNLAHYMMAHDVIKSLGYPDAEIKIREFSETITLLENQILTYGRLMELCGFFSRLYEQSKEAASAKTLHGQRSPYAYI